MKRTLQSIANLNGRTPRHSASCPFGCMSSVRPNVPKVPSMHIEVAALPLVASSLSGWPIGHSNVFGGSMLGSGRRHGARDGVDKSQIISLTRAVTSRSMNGFVMPLSGSVRRFTLVPSRGDVTVSRRTPALYALGKADPVLLGRRIRQAKRRGEFDSFCSSHRAHSRKPTI